MNTERLHSLIQLFLAVNKKYNFVNLLQNVEVAYTASVQSPTQQNAQNFANAVNALRKAAIEFPQGTLSPSRRKLLEAIGGLNYYGENIINRIDEIIDSADTPSDVVAQIQKFTADMTAFVPIIQALDDNFNKLGIKVEDTPKDSAEIEILIPETMIDTHLDVFVKEMGYVNTAISDIREVVTGKRTALDIRSLGSGSYELYVTVDLVTGAQVLIFITAVVQLINTIMQIRRDRESMKKRDAPEKVIKELKIWEEKLINEKIDKARDDLLKQYKGEKERREELDNALIISLNRLADRIDRGMDIDVTTAATVDEKEGEESAEIKKQVSIQRSLIESIQTSTNTISQIERNREPILQLPISDEENTSEK